MSARCSLANSHCEAATTRSCTPCPPGLTGLWQIEGRSTVGNTARTDLDRRYLESWSPLTNVRLLARTPRIVLRGVGAH